MPLRSLNTYKICINTQQPVMLKGLPLKLAIAVLICILLSIGILLFLINLGWDLIYIWIPILIALIIGVGGVYGINLFYKRYGINGFRLERRSKKMVEEIRADKSIKDIINGKSK